MSWRGQAPYALLHQSTRFERGWKLLSGTYKRTVVIPKNVVLFIQTNVH
jgi:hypothetical protein